MSSPLQMVSDLSSSSCWLWLHLAASWLSRRASWRRAKSARELRWRDVARRLMNIYLGQASRSDVADLAELQHVAILYAKRAVNRRSRAAG